MYPYYSRDDAVIRLKNGNLAKVNVGQSSCTVSFCSGALWNAGSFSSDTTKSWEFFCKYSLELEEPLPFPPMNITVAEHLKRCGVDVLPYNEWP